MAAKLFLRPHCLSLPSFSHQPFIAYPLFQLIQLKPLCSAALTSITAAAAITEPLSSLPYGPSLHKGKTPFQSHPVERERDGNEDSERLFDEANFTRVFDIAALRVPSNDCHLLESRLRGHLLNWPRVRNIARVPGDEIDPEAAKLIGAEKEGNLESLERRISGKAEGDGEELSPVLHREKLANEFNSRGFVNFRNLSKISRPKRMKKKEDNEKKNGEREMRVRKSEFVAVEVVNDDEDEGEDFRGLLGDEFVRRRWRGSTRLLLLDERYAMKGIDELPEAIKAMFRETREITHPDIELVSCKLTLLYDYWSMNEILEMLLPEGMVIPSAFETVGHIAHLNLKDEHLPYKKIIAKVILDKNKAKIRTVVNKMNSIHNDYRTMQLEVLAGNHSLVTTVVENGLKFNFDFALVYWNSRLGTERQRLLSGFTRSDVVCDVFCGVGPIAISAARIVKRVYANDLNPHAIEYLDRNCVLNKLERKIKVFNMDGRRFISSMFTSEKGPSVTQVVMNLPNDAAEYLDAFKGIYQDRPRSEIRSFPKIHVYGFSKARDPEFDFHERIRIALSEVAVDVEMRKVRLVAPGKWMLCATFTLPQSVAFAKIAPVDR